MSKDDNIFQGMECFNCGSQGCSNCDRKENFSEGSLLETVEYFFCTSCGELHITEEMEMGEYGTSDSDF